MHVPSDIYRFIYRLFYSFNVSTFLRFCPAQKVKRLLILDCSWTHYIVHYKPSTNPELTTRVPTSFQISLVPQKFGTFLQQISQFIIPLSFSKFPHSLDVLLNLPLISLFNFFKTPLSRLVLHNVSSFYQIFLNFAEAY